jgi:hypothetical protein
MAGSRRTWWGAWVLALGLLAPGAAQAGFFGTFCHDCPPPDAYPHWHYWTPALYRLTHQRPNPPYIYPPVRNPCIQPRDVMYLYRCPPLSPAEAAATYGWPIVAGPTTGQTAQEPSSSVGAPGKP